MKDRTTDSERTYTIVLGRSEYADLLEYLRYREEDIILGIDGHELLRGIFAKCCGRSELLKGLGHWEAK